MEAKKIQEDLKPKFNVTLNDLQLMIKWKEKFGQAIAMGELIMAYKICRLFHIQVSKHMKENKASVEKLADKCRKIRWATREQGEGGCKFEDTLFEWFEAINDEAVEAGLTMDHKAGDWMGVGS